MIGYKGEFWVKGVDEKVRPDIVIQIKMKEKKQRQQWTLAERSEAKAWMIEQRDKT